MTTDKKQVVILGAGYAGLRTALKLEKLLKNKTDRHILLIDQYDYHQLKTELHELAADRTNAETVTIPIPKLLKGKNIDFLQAQAISVDFAQNLITTTKGRIKYHKLVIALGSETEFFSIPNLSKSAFTLASADDATRIRKHIHDIFAEAHSEQDETKRRALLTVVVGGGGFTGVELATELIDYISKLCIKFGIAQSDTQLIVIEAGESILAGFDPELANSAERAMKAKRIKLMLKTPCISVEDDTVNLRTGQKIQTRTLIWTGGVRACDLVAEAGLKYGPRRRVVVNPFLESVDHFGVYVIGDNALVMDPETNRPIAPTAQLALQQADYAAMNIYAEITGNKRIRYTPKVAGQFVSLGNRNAVGWVGKFKVTGFLAWFLKRMTLVRYLLSLDGVRLTMSRLPALLS